MIANDEVDAVGKSQLKGVLAKKLCLVGKTCLDHSPARDLDNRPLFHEINLPCTGAERHEAQQTGATSEIKHGVFRAKDPRDRSLILPQLDAIGEISEVFLKDFVHSRNSTGFRRAKPQY